MTDTSPDAIRALIYDARETARHLSGHMSCYEFGKQELDRFGDATDKAADTLEALLKERDKFYRTITAGRTMESAIAEFLDADVAWTNDECDEAVVVAAINECKRCMYAFREARAALPPAPQEKEEHESTTKP